MADASEKFATTAASTVEKVRGSSTEPMEDKKRWEDVEDGEAQPQQDLVSEDNIVSELNLGSLSIKDKEKLSLVIDEPEDSNIKAVTSDDTPYTLASKFEDLNLSEELLKGLYVEMKFQKPSRIQAVSLPMILTPPYKHLIAQAHNGSGKTTCFVLGMLSRVDPRLSAPQALCICPTRELAIQNMEVLQKMGKYSGITSECAVRLSAPARRPPVSAHVVIGTPGTILTLMTNKKLGASCLKILVFDEADQMLASDGFRLDSVRIKNVIERVNRSYQLVLIATDSNRQITVDGYLFLGLKRVLLCGLSMVLLVLLFSATFDESVKDFVSRIVKDYNQLFVKREELSLESVKQYKVNCPDEQAKILVIKDQILEFGEKVGQTIIFVRMKATAGMLHRALVDMGYEVTTIHGNMSLEDRDKIVKEFKDCLTQVLIATDVLARGFDQQQVNLVINFDLPVKYNDLSEPDYEAYLHRAGRAGRFGRKGAVFNLLLDERDEGVMAKIEKFYETKVKEVKSWNSAEDFIVALKDAGLLK